MATGVRDLDQSVMVVGFPAAVPSSASPVWVSMKRFDHWTAWIFYKNATTVTGSAITVNQATAVAGTSTKAVAFGKMHAAVNTTDTHALVETAVVSNTFTTDATNSQSGIYVVSISGSDLDVANGFNAIQIGLGNATAATIFVLYQMSGADPARYAGGYDSFGNPQSDTA